MTQDPVSSKCLTSGCLILETILLKRKRKGGQSGEGKECEKDNISTVPTLPRGWGSSDGTSNRDGNSWNTETIMRTGAEFLVFKGKTHNQSGVD